jgi:hypothetical protein
MSRALVMGTPFIVARKVLFTEYTVTRLVGAGSWIVKVACGGSTLVTFPVTGD